MKKRLSIITLTLALSMGASQPAWAIFGVGDVVFDPGNYVENVLNVLKSIKQVAQQAQAYRAQLMQLKMQVRMIKSWGDNMRGAVDPSSLIYDIQNMQRLHRQLGRMYGNLSELAGVVKDTSRKMAASDTTYKEYQKMRATAAKRGNQQAQASIQHDTRVMQSVKHNYSALRETERQIPASAGIQQSLKTMNANLLIIARQNNQLLSIIANADIAKNRKKVVEGTDDTGAKARRQKNLKKYEKAQQKQIAAELKANKPDHDMAYYVDQVTPAGDQD
jgi:P-type conjugative transfer protein TrbJ